MKKQRIRVLAASMAIMSALGGVTAFAENSTDIYSSTLDVKLHGYIDFLEGQLFVKDKIWYNGIMSGSDSYLMSGLSDDTTVSVTPGTNKKTLSTIKLTPNRTLVAENEVSCGTGGSYGKLVMKCGTTSKTIRSDK